MKRFLYILLAALLLATVNTALAEDEILIVPVDAEAMVLEDVTPSVDINVAALENVVLQSDTPVANYVSGNLAHFVQPSDGDILSPGEVDILLTYDDDGVWGSSGHLLTDAEIYNNYMPTYLGITKDGHTEVVAHTGSALPRTWARRIPRSSRSRSTTVRPRNPSRKTPAII